ncbi:hypothetical protein HMPREF9944_01414 [Segatella maculosa OT 289]|uniref:Uncharacterized protein n=1 Tax=Segatella maculosa OT 289 TaxID=999422 RepID=H1HMM0_9BACT|nr:hypothetical protein HMPREF9944_01414 [Segatella maculosa OT 289]
MLQTEVIHHGRLPHGSCEASMGISGGNMGLNDSL